MHEFEPPTYAKCKHCGINRTSLDFNPRPCSRSVAKATGSQSPSGQTDFAGCVVTGKNAKARTVLSAIISKLEKNKSTAEWLIGSLRGLLSILEFCDD